jgi:hypothetical protein
LSIAGARTQIVASYRGMASPLPSSEPSKTASVRQEADPGKSISGSLDEDGYYET